MSDTDAMGIYALVAIVIRIACGLCIGYIALLRAKYVRLKKLGVVFSDFAFRCVYTLNIPTKPRMQEGLHTDL